MLSPLPSYLATYPRHCRIAAISRSPISLSHTTRTPSITVACPRRGRTQPLPIRRHGVRVDATRINEIHGSGFSADRPSRAIYTATGRDSVSFSGLFIQRVAAGKETFEESTRRKREKKRRSEGAERSGGPRECTEKTDYAKTALSSPTETVSSRLFPLSPVFVPHSDLRFCVITRSLLCSFSLLLSSVRCIGHIRS